MNAHTYLGIELDTEKNVYYNYTSKFFIMSPEFDKNISDWWHDCTDYKNDLDFFLRLGKWPKIAVKKKAKFFRTFSNKSRSILVLHKSIKTKSVPLNWYFSMKNFFRKIRKIFDVENWLWKLDFGTFWRLFLAI